MVWFIDDMLMLHDKWQKENYDKLIEKNVHNILISESHTENAKCYIHVNRNVNFSFSKQHNGSFSLLWFSNWQWSFPGCEGNITKKHKFMDPIWNIDIIVLLAERKTYCCLKTINIMSTLEPYPVYVINLK